jgi:hypothetical protein
MRFRAASVTKTITNGTPQPQPPPPLPVDVVKECIGIWNADGAVRATYGFHFYGVPHNVREVWVFTIPNTIYPSVLRCAVIAVVAPADYEFGNDGVVRKSSGSDWQPMIDVPEFTDKAAVQQQASANANASLQPDGSLQRK